MTQADFTNAAEATANDVPYILVAEGNDKTKQITIRNLSVRTPGHQGKTLISKLDMTLNPGDRVVLTGASGTGKTTVAKALVNQWDYGSGIIRMPSGMKMMFMSQQPHFPNTQLRSIMNMAPPGSEKFADEELTKVLQAVGRDILIQHIPGQQVQILIGDLLPHMKDAVKSISGGALTGQSLQDIRRALAPVIHKLVAEQFHYVQYVPEKQKELLKKQLRDTLESADISFSNSQLDTLTDTLTDDIDIALAKPLYNRLNGNLPELAEKRSGRIFSYTPVKAAFLAWNIKRTLAKKMRGYLNNEDTDDQDREIRLNKTQASYIAKSISERIREELGKHTATGALSQLFNNATWPVSLAWTRIKAGMVANTLISDTAFFMDRQIVTGDEFRSQFSGGEKQKLMIAMAQLHKPDILILDEVTAALDEETGGTLYRELMESLPKDTIVLSIAHNRHIRKYHTHIAVLKDGAINIWPMADAPPELTGEPESPRICASCACGMSSP